MIFIGAKRFNKVLNRAFGSRKIKSLTSKSKTIAPTVLLIGNLSSKTPSQQPKTSPLFQQSQKGVLPRISSVSPVLKRYYARFPRRPRVDHDRDVERDIRQGQEQDRQQEVGGWYQQGQQGDMQKDFFERTQDAITPQVQRHLVQVYGLLATTTGLSAAGVMTSLFVFGASSGLSLLGFGGLLGCVFGMWFVDPANVGLRRALLFGVGGFSGLSIAPLVGMAAAISPLIVLQAAIGTAAIFAGFSLAAMYARRGLFLMLGGPLMAGFILILFAGLGSAFLPMLGIGTPALWMALHNINVYLGLLLFSVFISYDTQRMVESARNGTADVVSDATSMFLNCFNIFTRLLIILMGSRS